MGAPIWRGQRAIKRSPQSSTVVFHLTCACGHSRRHPLPRLWYCQLWCCIPTIRLCIMLRSVQNIGWLQATFGSPDLDPNKDGLPTKLVRP